MHEHARTATPNCVVFFCFLSSSALTTEEILFCSTLTPTSHRRRHSKSDICTHTAHFGVFLFCFCLLLCYRSLASSSSLRCFAYLLFCGRSDDTDARGCSHEIINIFLIMSSSFWCSTLLWKRFGTRRKKKRQILTPRDTLHGDLTLKCGDPFRVSGSWINKSSFVFFMSALSPLKLLLVFSPEFVDVVVFLFFLQPHQHTQNTPPISRKTCSAKLRDFHSLLFSTIQLITATSLHCTQCLAQCVLQLIINCSFDIPLLTSHLGFSFFILFITHWVCNFFSVSFFRSSIFAQFFLTCYFLHNSTPLIRHCIFARIFICILCPESRINGAEKWNSFLFGVILFFRLNNPLRASAFCYFFTTLFWSVTLLMLLKFSITLQLHTSLKQVHPFHTVIVNAINDFTPTLWTK